MKGTAIYLRLSQEDERCKRESESIKNQREFLLRYAKEHDYTPCREYSEAAVSQGTNF